MLKSMLCVSQWEHSLWVASVNLPFWSLMGCSHSPQICQHVARRQVSAHVCSWPGQVLAQAPEDQPGCFGWQCNSHSLCPAICQAADRGRALWVGQSGGVCGSGSSYPGWYSCRRPERHGNIRWVLLKGPAWQHHWFPRAESNLLRCATCISISSFMAFLTRPFFTN